MKSAIHLLRFVPLITAIGAATLCEPQAAQGQAPVENTGSDYRETIDRFLEWERENPEANGHKDEFEREIDRERAHQREVDANNGGRYLCDVEFPKRGDHIAFGSDGKQLFCGLQDGTVRVANIDSRELAAAIRFAENPITSLVVSPDGRRLIVGCAVEKSVRTWDLVAAKEVATLIPAKPWSGEEMALSANGRYAALTGYSSDTSEYTAYLGRTETRHVVDPRVYVYDIQSAKLLRSIRCTEGPLPFLLSPDGTSFAMHRGGDEGVHLWECRGTADPIDPLAKIKLRGSCSFSPDGKLIAAVVAMADESRMHYLALRLFETATGNEKGEYHLGQCNGPRNFHREFAYAPVFSPSGNSVAYSSYEPYGKVSVNGTDFDMFSLCILNLKTLQKTYLPRKDLEARSICFSLDGRRLAAILGPDHENMTVRIWEVPSDGPALLADFGAADSAVSSSPSEPARGLSEPKDRSQPEASTAAGWSIAILVAASIVMLLIVFAAVRARVTGRSRPIPLSKIVATPTPAADASQVPTMAPVVELGEPIQVNTTHTSAVRETSSNVAVRCPACAQKLRVPSGLKVGTKVSCKRCLCVFRTGGTEPIAARAIRLPDAAGTAH